MKFRSRWAGARSLYRHIGRNLVACLALLVGVSSTSYAASAKISTPAVAPAAGQAQVAANAKPRLATFQAEANRARKWLGRRFGTLKHPMRVDFLLQELPTAGGGRASAETVPMSRGRYGLVEDWDGRYAVCVIRVTPTGRVLPRPARRGLLAHEATHCFQFETLGTRATRTVGARWLREGSAEWASYEYAQRAWFGPKYWDQYESTPEKSLYKRLYDAVGFFAHVDRKTKHHPWRVVRSMWRAARPGRNGGGIDSQAAFRVAQRAGGGTAFARTWAMSFARRPKPYGDDWEMRGIGLRPPSGANLTEIHVRAPGDRYVRIPAAASVGLYLLTADDGAVIQVRGEGYGALQFVAAGGGAPVPRKLPFEGKYSIRYCVHECSSTCSDGSKLDHRMVVAEPGAAIFAFTGGAGGAEMEVQQLSVDEACRVRGYPCIYTIPEATQIIMGRVAGHHPVEEVLSSPYGEPYRDLPPPLRAGVPLTGLACFYMSSYGDSVWVDALVDGTFWVTYMGYPSNGVIGRK